MNPDNPLFTTPQIPKLSALTMPQMPPSAPAQLLEESRNNHASEFHKRLSQWINEFDSNLDEAHEVGIRLVNFGQAITFHLEQLGYWNPSLIIIKGSMETGEPVELIQHVSQISILLTRLPRQNPEEPKKPMGFGTQGE